YILPQYNFVEIQELNDNIPCFTREDVERTEYIQFSELDALGRCGAASGCLGPSLLPIQERGYIGMVKPSGWHTVKYDFIDGKYLYNRCHLIAYELCGVNADERNLITGTRYMNIDGMLGIENSICDYIHNTGNHVCYRVTPRYNANDLVAKGVQIEAYSIEDEGYGICLNEFCFNIQPGVTIDYSSGNSSVNDSEVSAMEDDYDSENDSSKYYYVPDKDVTYVINNNTRRFHLPDCSSVREMKPKNRREFFGTREELIDAGYIPCKACDP
ncbi:MAG: DNA/RNA non-specific endonuclease, partial [Ruminococcus sp.]|nr:DNA/RNA non-specific endonuclease [Ruminococcus sp.]